MHIRFAIAATVLFAATASSAMSADFPARRPGLWTLSLSVEGRTMPGGGNQMCIDAKTDAKMMRYGMASKEADCSALSIQGTGGTRTVDSVCHMNGGTQKTHIVAAYQGDSAYHMDMQSTFSPPIAGHSQSHSVQDAKWIGPCPADLKPGEMTINGMKINLVDSLAHPLRPARMTRAQMRALMKAHAAQ